MGIRKLIALISVVLILCVGLSGAVFADIPDPSDCNTAYNLCGNCDIETDISDGSWTDTSYADVSWSDAQSRSINHSLLVTVTNTTSTYGATSDCIPLGRTTQSGDYYSVAGYVYLTSAARNNLDRVRIRVGFYANPDCTGTTNTRDVDLEALSAQADTWNRVAGTFTPTADRQSVRVRLTQNNSSSSGAVSVYWDDVLFFQSTANAVKIVDFAVPDQHFPWALCVGAAALVLALRGGLRHFRRA